MTVLFLLVLAAAVAWKVYQLTKAPRDGALRSVTLCLVCAALSYPVAMPGGASGVDTVAGHGAAKLVQNLLLLGTVYFLMCFYLYSSADRSTSRRRARLEAVVVLGVAGVLVVAATTVPQETFVGSFSSADMTITQLAAFYGIAGLYLTYALGAAGVWTVRYARLSPRPHSTGLWITAVGLLAMAAACAVRAVFVAIRWQGGTVPKGLMASVAMLLVVSILLFVVGSPTPVPAAASRRSGCGGSTGAGTSGWMRCGLCSPPGSPRPSSPRGQPCSSGGVCVACTASTTAAWSSVGTGWSASARSWAT